MISSSYEDDTGEPSLLLELEISVSQSERRLGRPWFPNWSRKHGTAHPGPFSFLCHPSKAIRRVEEQLVRAKVTLWTSTFRVRKFCAWRFICLATAPPLLERDLDFDVLLTKRKGTCTSAAVGSVACDFVMVRECRMLHARPNSVSCSAEEQIRRGLQASG